jgi:protein-S-isoprenylcysteine O-methyltransferase Ste14
MSKSPAYDRPSSFPWPPVLFVAAILLAIAGGRLSPLEWPGLDDLPARIIGLAIGAAGIALIVWALITFAREKTTVMPDKPATHLITSGPFRFFRNPIYLGEAFLLLGLAELSKNVWFVIAAMLFAAFVTWLAILPEERHLEARFGEAYTSYKSKTRRWI